MPFDLVARPAAARRRDPRSATTSTCCTSTSHHIAFGRLVARDAVPRAVGAVRAQSAAARRRISPRCRSSTPTTRSGSASALAGERARAAARATGARELATRAPSLELPTDFPRPSAQAFDGRDASDHDRCRRSLVAQLEQLGRRTRRDALHGAARRVRDGAAPLHGPGRRPRRLAERGTLARRDGRADRLLREHARAARALRGGSDVRAAARRSVRESALGAYEHQDMPFEKLVLELQRGAASSATRRSSRWCSRCTTDGAAPRHARRATPRCRPYGVDDGTTKFDLTLFMSRAPTGCDARAARTHGPLRRRRRRARPRPSARRARGGGRDARRRACRELALLDRGGARALAAWNDDAQSTIGAPATIARAVRRAQAARAPERDGAIVAGDARCTYAELDARANQLAHHCARSASRPTCPVGTRCSTARPTSSSRLLGVLKAGGAYVPISPGCARGARGAADHGERERASWSRRRRYASGVPADVQRRRARSRRRALGAQPARRCRTSWRRRHRLAYVLLHVRLDRRAEGRRRHARATSCTTRARSPRVLGDVPRNAAWRRPRRARRLAFGMVSTLGADLGNTRLFPALLAGGTLHLIARDVATEPARYARVRRVASARRPQDHAEPPACAASAGRVARARARAAAQLARARRRGAERGSSRARTARCARVPRAESLWPDRDDGRRQHLRGDGRFDARRATRARRRCRSARRSRTRTLHVLDAHREPVPVGVVGRAVHRRRRREPRLPRTATSSPPSGSSTLRRRRARLSHAAIACGVCPMARSSSSAAPTIR